MLSLKKSLGAKVLLLVCLVSLAAFGGLFFANSYWQRTSNLEIIRRGAEKTASLIFEAISEPMSVGNNAATTKQFERIHKKFADVRAYLTDFNGNITYSTEDKTLRKDVNAVVESDALNAILKESLQDSDEVYTHGRVMPLGDTPYFLEVSRIRNEKACHHCHGPNRKSLGAMVVMQDISPAMAAMHGQQIKSGAISLAGLAALVVLLYFLLRIGVMDRVRGLMTTAGRVEKGDLDISFDSRGSDELAQLGHHLESMVVAIKDQLEYNKGVLQGIIVPLYVADGNGVITFCNKPLANILGTGSCEQFEGRKAGEYFRDPEGGDVTEQSLTECGVRSGFIRFKKDDGTVTPLRYELSPLCDAEGRVTGAIGVMMDLTQEEADKEKIRQHGENLQQVAEQVMDVAHSLADAARELSMQMDELTGSVDSTARQTDDLAASMEQMNATVFHVANNAGEVASASEQARDVAHQGGKEVESTLQTTREVAQRAERLAGALATLDTRAENIGAVVAVINEIADQTNLLALNAAIEAARAGEAGKGFAVVADEVRKLAERTMQATKEVEGVVVEIQQGTRDAVQEMGATKDMVEESSTRAENAGNVLEKILEQAGSIAEKVQSIAGASQQQSSASESINESVSRINNLSQEGARRIEEANDAITRVSEMAGNLASLVELFREDRRSHSRLDVSGAGITHTVGVRVDGSTVEMKLINISAGGARLEATQSTRTLMDQEAVAFLPRMPKGSGVPETVPAQVRWAGGRLVGIQFNTPWSLGPSELERLVHSLKRR
ncbi:methyl-accepting chemotaxis protein [Oceanidesulfovibrio marinus]|uniref:Chemotaxis protein n=1 Tax=Oceanidesulfovibrio marinus TaxID=370038 RepID=A0A6P1ZE19_9BACT|nr:methyl-accepting chemotaxis protein [Oceanidesulfovibrio marinus]QJT09300.1 PAS domain-containing protein [Oceanidesulfovibrio marinus]TVM32794.1 chemotaxis protein [Oceanidesulfovibrio marinus]